MDSWIEANIFVEQGKQDEVLLSFIKPLPKETKSGFISEREIWKPRLC
jgi:hypothetical protein